MTLQEIYDKYKHLDILLSSKEACSGGASIYAIASDMWIAIKEEVENK